MFNNMKNKIREKTGTDIPKFVPNSKLSMSSRQGSESSINSLPYTAEIIVNNSSSSTTQKSSNFREIDESTYNEWNRKEEDFQKILKEKEYEWKKKEQYYKNELEEKQKELSESHKQVEKYKNKIFRYQEDKDQLEQFQTQEMAKIKHLLLAKEKENSENASALKESLALLESLKSEVSRLRPLEEQISNYESSTESDAHTKCQELSQELEQLRNKYEETETERLHSNEQLKIDVQSLVKSLEDEKIKVKELEDLVTDERRQRDEAFLRNAQMSQQIQIAQCDLRSTQQDNDDLMVKLRQMEQSSKSKTNELDLLREEMSELKNQVNGSKLNDLENELNDKNKTIRILQQRLADMKKTLQQELRNNTSGEETPPSQTKTISSLEDDVNLIYLKHVVIKFLTCREYEAQHLTRAVAMLLRLSPEEEQQLRETMEMRTSWWPSKPRLLPR